jgi:uncharacterized MnhB-related membrane protein
MRGEGVMNWFATLLLLILVVCAVAVSFTKNLLNAVVIFSAYSFVMAIIWFVLESPDLAITEAAVGAGVTSILFFVTLKKMNQIHMDDEEEKEGDYEAEK